MAQDYIPQTLSGRVDWGDNFATLLTANPATYGQTAPIALEVQTAFDTFQAAYVTSTSPATRTPATVAATQEAMANWLGKVRPVAVNISLLVTVTDEDKAAIGVTVRTGGRTPVPPPATAPELNLLAVAGQRLSFNYRDSATPTTKAKPAGVTGMQLWAAIGTVPAVDPAQGNLVQVSTKSPGAYTVPLGNAGKIVTLFGRWMTRGGPAGEAQFGPWSAPITAVAQM